MHEVHEYGPSCPVKRNGIGVVTLAQNILLRHTGQFFRRMVPDHNGSVKVDGEAGTGPPLLPGRVKRVVTDPARRWRTGRNNCFPSGFAWRDQFSSEYSCCKIRTVPDSN